MDQVAAIDDYIAGHADDVQAILRKLRHELASVLPACQEKISYGMQTFFDKKVADYRSAKRTLQFP